MNASIDTTPAASSTSTNLRPMYIGIAVTVALAAGVALVQWTFAADFTRNIDWTQTAFLLYIAATGTIGSLLVLPGLVADAQRTA